MGEPRDSATFLRPPVRGVEILHAHFRRHEYPRHAHETATIALMDSGAASFFYRGEVHTAAAGDVFLINPGAVHTGALAHPEGYRYRVLYLGPDALARLPEPDSDQGHGSQPPLAFRETVVRDPVLAATLDQTHRALTSTAAGPLVQEYLLTQVGELLRARYTEPGRQYAPSVTAPAGGTEHRAVAAARDYLEARLAEKVSLLDLAAVARLSPYRLTRLFSAEVGMPPHAYQNMLRVGQARKLLANNARAAAIACQVGFCDQAHLNRVFKRYTGVTPHQYRMGAQ